MKYLEESAAEAINLEGPNLKVVSLFLFHRPARICINCTAAVDSMYTSLPQRVQPIKHPGSGTSASRRYYSVRHSRDVIFRNVSELPEAESLQVQPIQLIQVVFCFFFLFPRPVL